MPEPKKRLYTVIEDVTEDEGRRLLRDLHKALHARHGGHFYLATNVGIRYVYWCFPAGHPEPASTTIELGSTTARALLAGYRGGPVGTEPPRTAWARLLDD